ncbi:hypothetical protein SKAU_G00173940 [Synaphobranchus kaupii]|uniref:Uncharacterized protein n=1 Tax=Synaphobranchus kaupii TaxID=118154 RepID=A0A9Q1IYV4_SYNKA|nr:hypothetical protein SKAU_G00173940 [Synaphobranchus kaupii]
MLTSTFWGEAERSAAAVTDPSMLGGSETPDDLFMALKASAELQASARWVVTSVTAVANHTPPGSSCAAKTLHLRRTFYRVEQTPGFSV